MKLDDIADPDAPFCASGRRPFRTETEARAQLGRARAFGSARDKRLPGRTESGVEECPVCHWWHLTARPRR